MANVNVPNFDVSKEDSLRISKIVARAVGMGIAIDGDVLAAHMDLSATHNTCQMRLDDMLDAPDSDFTHDFCGIQTHIDRKTGQLMDCFVPRYALSN